jgi:hypothetical protein
VANSCKKPVKRCLRNSAGLAGFEDGHRRVRLDDQLRNANPLGSQVHCLQIQDCLWRLGTFGNSQLVLMKSRRNRESKWGAQFQPLDLDRVRIGVKRIETKRGVEYSVQTTTGRNAEEDKSWVCPHCNLAISKGQNHTVAWDSVRGVETRRHFHNSCWKAFQGPLL